MMTPVQKNTEAKKLLDALIIRLEGDIVFLMTYSLKIFWGEGDLYCACLDQNITHRTSNASFW